MSVLRFIRLLYALSFLPGVLYAQLPEGPGKSETIQTCSRCHEAERALSLKQDRDGWQNTVNKMVGLGLQADDDQIRRVVDYLAKSLPADAVQRLNINKASEIELEAALSLPRPVAAAVVQYRVKHGDFKSIEDLKKVPGVDAAKVDAKKGRLSM